MKNIIFDLDGTLLDTLQDLANSTNHALRECGYPQRTLDEVRQMVGNGVGKLIQRAVPAGSSEADTERCLRVFKAHYAVHCTDLTRPYDGIMPLLAALQSRGIGMAIVSNKLHTAVEELNRQFFADHISVAVGETPKVSRKPAPDMLYKAMEALHTDRHNTLYVGDSDVDITTARNAGVRCISVLWGFRDKDFLLQHGATTLVSKPMEILDLV